MKIAILGATSQIAKDLISAFLEHDNYELTLFGRKPEVIIDWPSADKKRNSINVNSYDQFINSRNFDWIINFIGVGDPAKAVEMGQSIFEITSEYDNLAISYLKANPGCRYIFLSSGAIYGSNFDKPINLESKALFAVNEVKSQDWYAVAKLHAEYRHRSMANFGIVDVRVFNYFSHTQSLKARFFLTELLRSIKEKSIFKTSFDNMVRDFLSPSDFYQLIKLIIGSPKINLALDCYSKSPIDKMSLLEEMKKKFGLEYELNEEFSMINATGIKEFYFSENKIAKTIGYEPKMTSLDGILIEAQKLLGSEHVHR